MKTRFPIGLNLAVGLSVIFSPPAGLPPSSFQPVYAQGSGEKKFWMLDGHSHPTWSVYARRGTIAQPDSDLRYTLPLAEQGGLGASFFNTASDEFLAANPIAVKKAFRQFDHFYLRNGEIPGSTWGGHQCRGGSGASPPGQGVRFDRFWM